MIMSFFENNLNLLDWETRSIVVFVVLSIYSYFDKKLLSIKISYNNEK